MAVIINSIIVFGALAVIFGTLLGYAGVMFKVEEDTKLTEMHKFLPGANCGGCGHTGCESWARAIKEGNEKLDTCLLISDENLTEIKKIMET